MVRILIREFNGSDRQSEKIYVKSDNDFKLSIVNNASESLSLSTLRNFFTSVFLPNGYPESVSDDYIEYQLWDSIQAFASSITNTLATHAVLKGVGVGDATATPLAATITWLLRDGTSMVGRILFAYIQSTKLDSDCKKWRLFADVVNDGAICLDLLSPYFESHFTLIQCVSGLSKSLVGTAGSATRAALTQHQSRRNNLADVSAKDGSQETLVNLSALICSLIIVPIVSTNTNLVWLLFITFTLLHIFCNYRAVKSVSMETFNMTRFAIFVEKYLKHGQISTIRDVNKVENVWFFKRDNYDKYNEKIPIGVSLESHVKDCHELETLLQLYQHSDYILTYDSLSRIPIQISLKNDFNTSAILEAVLQALIIYYAHKTLKSSDWKLQEIIDEFGCESRDRVKLLKLTQSYAREIFKDISERATRVGWDLNRVLIIPLNWRYHFD